MHFTEPCTKGEAQHDMNASLEWEELPYGMG